MSIVRPGPFKKNFQRYLVPWTAFTDRQVSVVGMSEAERIAAGIKYQIVKAKHSNHGAAIAEQGTRGRRAYYRVGSAGFMGTPLSARTLPRRSTKGFGRPEADPSG